MAGAQLPFGPHVKVSLSQCQKASLSCAGTELGLTRGCSSPRSPYFRHNPQLVTSGQVPSLLRSSAQHQLWRDPARCHRTWRFVVCHRSSAWLKLQGCVSVTAVPWEPRGPHPFQALYPKSPRNCQAPHSFIPKPLRAMFIVRWMFQQIELTSFGKSFLALRFSNSRNQKSHHAT